MEVIHIEHPYSIKELHHPASIAFGNFDGVHIGHQQVIQKAIQLAKENQLQAGVMTFHPHPQEVLRSAQVVQLTPLEDKIALFEQLGVDLVYVVHFTPAFSLLTAQAFIEQYIVGLHIKHVITGFDFRFGNQGSGTVDMLSSWSETTRDFNLYVLPSIDNQQRKVSSSHIKELLWSGCIQEATQLLKRYYTISGTVIHGEKRGRTIGFPTANLQLAKQVVIPKHGVYAVRISWNNQLLEGVVNIGTKPTFHFAGQVAIETHIFDFNQSIYDEQICIQFVDYIRSEKKFASITELQQQIKEDMVVARKKLQLI